ncbi:MAG: hypothetical protein PHX93_03770 [Candidatus Peribacteraceae bacterium]|jgi:uncharacterized membrane protein YgdD (TMEM256/DUF423 family)|nr:hypothetical protein [Candidatus Peribacteraceae bacterium]
MLAPIFGLTLLTGFVFMVVWAVRFATKHQLLAAMSWFLAIGIIGILLAGTLSGMALRRFSSLRPGYDGSLMMGGRFRNADKTGWSGCPYADEEPGAGSSSAKSK